MLSWLINEFGKEKINSNLRSTEFALLPHDGTIEDQGRCNFKLSLLKMIAVEGLLECTNSGELVTQNAFLKMYSNLDPMIIRKLFSFQAEMFRFYHKEKYRSNMLNMNEVNPEEKTDSGFIIEVG